MDLGQFDPRATAPYALSKASPFVASAGLVVDDVSGVRVVGHIELGPDHFTPWGVVHGGVYTTAVETAASIGAQRSSQRPRGIRGRRAQRNRFSSSEQRWTSRRRCRATATGPRPATVAGDDHGPATAAKTIARGQVRLQNVPLPAAVMSDDAVNRRRCDPCRRNRAQNGRSGQARPHGRWSEPGSARDRCRGELSTHRGGRAAPGRARGARETGARGPSGAEVRSLP